MIARSFACLMLALLPSSALSQTRPERPPPERPQAYNSPARQAQEMFDFRQKGSFFYEKILRQDWNTALNYMQTLSFANCAMRFNHGRKVFASSLKHSASTSLEWWALNKLARRYQSCAPTIGRVHPAVLRGAIAEALWRTNGTVSQTRSVAPTAEYLVGLFEMQPRGDVRHRFADIPMSWLGRCAAFAMPDRSAALLKSHPGSLEEKGTAEALIASSDRCGLKPTNLPLDVSIYRAAVADGMYLSSLQGR